MKKYCCLVLCGLMLLCAVIAGGEAVQPATGNLESGENILTISMVGDCAVGDIAKSLGHKSGLVNKVKEAGYAWPFSLVADMFAQDDLTIANCEGTITKKTKARDGIMFPIVAPVEYAEVFKQGNVDVCNLANNHCLRDFGRAGAADTAAALDAQGIGWFYDENTWTTEIKGIKIGIVGYSYHMNDQKLKKYVQAMEQLRAEGCTFIIASAHWGTEPTLSKSTGKEYILNADQKYGYQLIDAGFDMVYSCGSHTCQMIRWYKGKVIFYGLSNFVFGADASPRDDDTAVAQVSFDIHEDGTLTAREMQVIPFKMHQNGDYRPWPLQDQAAKEQVWEKMFYNGWPKHKDSPAPSLPESFLTTGYVDFRTLPITEE